MTELPDRLLRDALDDTTSATPSAACVDAGTLAAWADGSLTGAERAAVETHAAGCARCLALLAVMTRTEPPRLERPRWRAPSLWLPLATVTAAVVIVVGLAVLEHQPPAPTAVGSTDTAATRSSPAAVPAPQAGAAPPSPAPAAGVASKSPAPRRREPSSIDTARQPALAAAKPTREQAPTAPASAAAPAIAAGATAALAAPPSGPTSPAQSAPPPAVRDEMAGARGGARALAAQSILKSAAPPVVIASPDRDSQWRIVGGVIEHTADGGATWQPQPIGVMTPMRAGAAPDPRVCWLAGAEGVVVRTTDGTTWTRIPFPEPVDLVAIQASDALHAAVTSAAGRRFTTSDGGATWIAQ